MTTGEKTLSNCPNQIQYNMQRDTPNQIQCLIMSTAVIYGRCAIWQDTLVSNQRTSNMSQALPNPNQADPKTYQADVKTCHLLAKKASSNMLQTGQATPSSLTHVKQAGISNMPGRRQNMPGRRQS